MLIAIISDLHDNLVNLEKCLTWCQQNKIGKIICCGDVGNITTLKFLSTNFSGEIFLVTGNAETYDTDNLASLKNITYFGELGQEIIGGHNIGFCHKDQEIPGLIKKSSETFNFIFYGHSHRPWLEKKNGIQIANPGNLANIFYPATFAILETANSHLELKLIDKL